MSTTTLAQDRDQDRRHDPRAKVDLLINRFLDGHPYMCRMTDISRTGARLVPILEPQRAPRFMGLQFQLPGADAIVTASGEAVTEGASTVGIRFTNLPPDSAWAIESFLKAS
jgi:PilZ domain